MNTSPYFLLLIRSSPLETGSLAPFQINFPFTIILKKLRIILKTSTTLLLKLLWIHLHLLLFWMLASKIVSLLLHIQPYNKPIVKTIHWAINITTTEVELFTIRCGINQTINIPNIKHIIIATDSIHATERIFDSSSHPYQTHSTAISMKLREFFKKDINNHIDFWDCPSKVKWPLHLSVNSDTRKFLMLPSFPCKSSWDFCKECNNESVLSSWKMSFQASDYKGRQFLELLDSNLNPLKPSTKNSSP